MNPLPQPKMVSAPLEAGIPRRPTLVVHTDAFVKGQKMAHALLDVLPRSIGAYGALHGELQAVLALGQPDVLRGFCAVLQTRLESTPPAAS